MPQNDGADPEAARPGSSDPPSAAGPSKPIPIAEERALVRDAAIEAGKIALAAFRPGRTTSAESWRKDSDNSIVTAADLAVNQALRTRLRAARPDYGWLSEEDEEPNDEGALTRLQALRVFVVDPIDGTRSFADGEPEFCVSVAIVEAGRPIAGALAAPALERVFCAGSGAGALADSLSIGVDAGPDRRAAVVSDPSEARVLAAGRDVQSNRWRNGPVRFKETGYVQPIALRLALAAEGVWDAVLAPRPVKEWDVAAGVLIAEEAGLTVTDFAGGRLSFNTPRARIAGILAAQRPLHHRLKEQLGPSR